MKVEKRDGEGGERTRGEEWIKGERKEREEEETRKRKKNEKRRMKS